MSTTCTSLLRSALANSTPPKPPPRMTTRRLSLLSIKDDFTIIHPVVRTNVEKKKPVPPNWNRPKKQGKLVSSGHYHPGLFGFRLGLFIKSAAGKGSR